jgi:quinol monooxygenase YgiN
MTRNRNDEQIRFVIQISVSDVERFKEIAARCVEVSRSEPGTLLYDWYLDEEAGTARLYEAYESVDAVIAHATGPVFTDVGVPLMEVATFEQVECFGDAARLAKGQAFWPTTYWGVPFASLDS